MEGLRLVIPSAKWLPNVPMITYYMPEAFCKPGEDLSRGFVLWGPVLHSQKDVSIWDLHHA